MLCVYVASIPVTALNHLISSCIPIHHGQSPIAIKLVSVDQKYRVLLSGDRGDTLHTDSGLTQRSIALRSKGSNVGVFGFWPPALADLKQQATKILGFTKIPQLTSLSLTCPIQLPKKQNKSHVSNQRFLLAPCNSPNIPTYCGHQMVSSGCQRVH